MAKVELPTITKLINHDVRELNKLIDEIKRLREAIKRELQRLEDNKQDA